MVNKCNCKKVPHKCKDRTYFRGNLPSGSPLPDTETLSSLPYQMIGELVNVLDHRDLLELCRHGDRFKEYCLEHEDYRKAMSKEAIREADEDMVENFYKDDDADSEMLMVAIANDDPLLLKRILNSRNFDKTILGEALTFAASHPNSTKIMQILIDNGAQPDISHLQSAILAAEPENASFLIDLGVKVTPELFADAVATRKAGIVKVLLVNGADPNVRVNGKLPIESAVLDNQWHLVKILMNYTDIDLITEKVGKKIRDYYAKYFHRAHMDSMENVEATQHPNLYQAIANKDARTFLQQLIDGKFTIDELLKENIYLSVAASGNLELVKILLNYTDPNGEKITASQLVGTVLDAVVLSKNPELIQFVFNQFTDSNGNRIKVEQIDQNTLLTAVMNGPKILKTLLTWRDDNGRGFTVNDIINTGVLEKLIERGDKQSLDFLLKFTDYSGQRLSNSYLLPLKELISSAKSQIDKMYTVPIEPISPPSFQKLVNQIMVEPKSDKKNAMLQNLAIVIETHGHELADAISDTVTKNIKDMMSKGVRFVAKLESGDTPINEPISDARAGHKNGIKDFISQLDPLKVAEAITADPKTLEEMMKGNKAGDVGTLLTKYAGDKPNESTGKWAQVAGKFLTAIPQRQVGAQMPYGSYDEKVQAAYEDLLNYPITQVKVLAKKMQINDCNNKSQKLLCKEIAQKIMYIHSDTLPTSDYAKCSRYTRKITPKELDIVRKKIYKEFIEYKDAVVNMSVNELQRLFERYDELCFDGDIQKYMANAGYTLTFKTSGEETFTTEGICTHKICDYTITIPTEYFKNVKRVTIVAGQPCKDQLECLLRVIEHEMVHLIIFMFCEDPFVTDQHGPLFMNMVRDLFGHSDYRHYIF